MKKDLQKLILERYKWLMLGVILVLGFVLFKGTYNMISSWHDQKNHLDMKQTEIEFYRDLKDPDIYPDGGAPIYYDPVLEKEITTKDFSEFRDYQLKVFNDEEHTMVFYNGISYGDIVIILMGVAIVAGFSLFFYDNKTHFNTLLFSSRYTRVDIYKMKFKVVGSSFIISLILIKLIQLMAIVSAIPKEYLNATFTDLLPSQMLQVLFLTFVFGLSSFAGLILGEWISGVLTIIGFWYTVPAVISAFPVGFFMKKHSVLKEGSFYYFDYYELMQLEKGISNHQLFIGLFCLILSVLFYYWGKRLYQVLSLEKNGNYLMFNHLRRPTQIVFLIYTFFMFNASSFFEALELAIKKQTEASAEYYISLPRTLRSIIIVAVVSYFLSNFVIYRKNPFTFSFKKLKKEVS